MTEMNTNCGRQLFVDDCLIEHSSLQRVWHSAVTSPLNPVLYPFTELEINHRYAPMSAVFNDGCWYDPADKKYKLFYNAGWYAGTALAVSDDGVNWERPDWGVVPGSNLLFPPSEHQLRDGSMCYLDDTAPVAERWKMMVFYRYLPGDGNGAKLYTSPDGVHWQERCECGLCGDNSSFFYDPFRSDWCFSIRHNAPDRSRIRTILRRKKFIDKPWPEIAGTRLACDELDVLEHPEPSIGDRAQLYDFNAVAYESVLLGVIGVFEGPENDVCFAQARPKTINLHYAFSRNGDDWVRPQERKAFLRCSQQPGAWDRGYLHIAGGIAQVFEDKLRFYYSGWSGESILGGGECGPRRDESAMYASSSVGFAELRRDGFASMHGSGELLTRPLAVDGQGLWINFCGEQLQVEVTDIEGCTLAGYSKDDSLTVSGDTVKKRIFWRGKDNLPENTVIRLRFIQQTGDLYSFWLSDSDRGCSGGYLGAGSRDYTGFQDL